MATTQQDDQIFSNDVAQEIRGKILEYLGIQYAPQEKQDEVLAKIGEVALQKILIATLEKLNEEEQKEYDALLGQKASPEELEAYIKEHVPDYEETTRKIVDGLMKDLAAAGNRAAQDL